MDEKPPSAKELAALRHIRNGLVHAGAAPSVRELQRLLGYSSPNAAAYLIARLIQRGFIARGADGRLRLLRQLPDDAAHARTVPVPLVGSASGGAALLSEENVEVMIPVSTRLAQPPHKYFLLRARGNSMNRAGIEDGDLVLVRQQPTAHNGERVVAVVDDEVTIKEFRQARDAVLLQPRSTNADHSPIFVRDDFQIQGVVVANDSEVQRMKKMSNATLVNATDLDLWANRRDAQGLLPELVRRLVHGSAHDVVRSGFRSGEGISLGGWDGIIEAKQGNAFVPGGSSAWELSSERNVSSKADDEYVKRTPKPGDVNPSEGTFVFVTPRRWSGRDSWAAARLAEGRWRDVRAYDADSLAEWLELAPGVHLWLSLLLGKHLEGAVDAETFWNDWSSATQPPVGTDLLFSGRSDAEQAIQTWLHEDAPTTALQCESRDEAAAVFVSALLRQRPEEQMAYLTRTVIVRDPAAWHRLAAPCSELILVPTFDVGDAIARAVRSGHRVVVALGRADSAADGTIVVPRVGRADAMSTLMSAGVPEDQARELASLARRSFLSFRRKLAQRPEVQQPLWARPQEAPSLLPALLAGAWDDSFEGDREALHELAQTPFDAVNATAVRWFHEDDPPLRQVRGAWYLVSKEDAWSLLSRFLTLAHVEHFNTVVLSVLGAPDPRFSVADEQRWMAAVLGHRSKFSEILRKSLSDTLAVMGARGGSVALSRGGTARDYAAKIVRELLEKANENWRVWASLSECGALPLLAEAAPDTFLDAAEEGLRGDPPILRELFREREGNTIFVSSPHTGLLWALETLAWSPEYLPRAALVLAKLARLDPGGNLNNRPKNSLRQIFLLWHPQTAATLEQRFRVLDTLQGHESDVAWSILSNLVPRGHDSASNNPAPRWREWKGDAGGNATRRELYAGARLVTERMVADVGTRGERWQDLIEALGTLPPDLHEGIVKRLTAINPDEVPPSDRATIWHALRATISRHRSFPDSGWALPAERLAPLTELYDHFTPVERAARYGWLFGARPELPEGLERDWTALEQATGGARKEAVRAILAEAGFEGVLDLISKVEQPAELGFALARTGVAGADEDRLLLAHLASTDPAHAQFGRGLAFGGIQVHGREWAEEKSRDAAGGLTPAQRAEILICLPSDEGCWDLAAACGAETEHHFWVHVRPFGIAAAGAEPAARKFLEHGRPYTAAVVLAMNARRTPALSPTLVLDALEQVLRTPPEDDDAALGGFGHHIPDLLDQLSEAEGLDEARMAQLEWAYLPLLANGGARRPSPRFLHRGLATNPTFFADVVSLLYRGEGEEARDLSDQDRVRVRHGHYLLESWRTVPGTGADGTVDGAYLKDWVDRAREILRERDREAIGDQLIGTALSGSAPGADGLWPDVSLRDTLEWVASRHLEKGVELGLRNSRGVTSRAVDAGGDQERKLAEKYDGFARATSETWPRTSAMLGRIADQYRSDGRREDDDAEQRGDLDQ